MGIYNGEKSDILLVVNIVEKNLKKINFFYETCNLNIDESNDYLFLIFQLFYLKIYKIKKSSQKLRCDHIIIRQDHNFCPNFIKKTTKTLAEDHRFEW